MNIYLYQQTFYLFQPKTLQTLDHNQIYWLLLIFVRNQDIKTSEQDLSVICPETIYHNNSAYLYLYFR